jgi:hypothetical protein
MSSEVSELTAKASAAAESTDHPQLNLLALTASVSKGETSLRQMEDKEEDLAHDVLKKFAN